MISEMSKQIRFQQTPAGIFGKLNDSFSRIFTASKNVIFVLFFDRIGRIGSTEAEVDVPGTGRSPRPVPETELPWAELLESPEKIDRLVWSGCRNPSTPFPFSKMLQKINLKKMKTFFLKKWKNKHLQTLTEARDRYFGATTVSIMTLAVTPLSITRFRVKKSEWWHSEQQQITILSITTLSMSCCIMTQSIKSLKITLLGIMILILKMHIITILTLYYSACQKILIGITIRYIT